MTCPSNSQFPCNFTVIGALSILIPIMNGCGGPPIVGGVPLGMGPAVATAGSTAADLAAWLPGNYSSAQQAASDPTIFDVRLHIARIWPDRADGPWMYVEQSMADAQHIPYRQRIYRIVTAPNNSVEVVVYEFAGSPLAWAGAWSDPGRFNALDPGLLNPIIGSGMKLTTVSPGRITGTGNEQEQGRRGAARATNELIVMAQEINMWDRGFNSEGKQVWGSVKGPTRLVKESTAVVITREPSAPITDEAAVITPEEKVTTP